MCCGIQVLTTQLEGEVDIKLDTFKEVRVASKNCSHAWVFTLRTKKRPLVLKDCALMNEEARQQFNLVSITVKAIKSGKSIITRSYTMLEVRYIPGFFCAHHFCPKWKMLTFSLAYSYASTSAMPRRLEYF